MGKCLLIDTAGIDDSGDLGTMRVEKSAAIARQVDIALILFANNISSRRETAVPAFSPPDSPLFQFPFAYKVWLVLPFDYNACVQPIASASLAAYMLGFLRPR